MSIYKYKINGHEHTLETFGIEIGDYVTIVRHGQYFPSFTKLFKYFWGMNTTIPLKDNGGTWKVMNMAVVYSEAVLHIRDINGNNVAIGVKGVRKIDYHKRNRMPIHDREVEYISTLDDNIPSHDYNEKLYKTLK